MSQQQQQLQPVVMINGITGKMGQAIVEACQRSNIEIAPFAIAGPLRPDLVDTVNSHVSVLSPSLEVKLFRLSSSANSLTTEAEQEVVEYREKLKKSGKLLIAIDFTLPICAERNAGIYNNLKLPFVMGTTGFDLTKLGSTTEQLQNYAVIAPNMSKQIVCLQAMLSYAATTFPNAFTNYSLSVVESHQSTKKDTSGTAKAMLSYFNQLTGKTNTVDDIVKIRDTKEQLETVGVPLNALSGHAWHTYTLRSEDDSVLFQFKHNVNGRATYADGVVDAVLFLCHQISTASSLHISKNAKYVFDMMDILKSGGMR